MKKPCPFCHQEIHDDETICPYCGSDLVPVVPIPEEQLYQTSLFDQPTSSEVEEVLRKVDLQSNSNRETSQNKETEESRKETELRMKREAPYMGAIRAIQNFFIYFAEKLVRPTDHFQRKRASHRSYGYISFGLATLISGFIVTRMIQAAFSRYNFFSQISILPGLTATPNYLFVFLKAVCFSLVLYIGAPTIIFLIKNIFLKRHQNFHYWMTQYAGMNAMSFVLLLATLLFSLVAPFGLFVVIVFLFFLHLGMMFITFVGSLYLSVNETRLDTIYLALIGIALYVFLLLSLLFLFI